MSLFNGLVSSALANRPEIAQLRPVVEKELLHHDILREMSRAGLLNQLTFLGGTCLRTCYGSPRLSEDLDFSCSISDDEIRHALANLGDLITDALARKYELPVVVEPPHRSAGNVQTWRIRINTRPERPDLPMQRIHVDVQAVPSRDPQPAVLRNPYRVDMGTMGLILNVESLPEILLDKLIALALRSGRIKNRDLWDIAWLDQQAVAFASDLLDEKLADRGWSRTRFRTRYQDQCAGLPDASEAFLFEMRRFLPHETVASTLADPRYWTYLIRTVRSFAERI